MTTFRIRSLGIPLTLLRLQCACEQRSRLGAHQHMTGRNRQVSSPAKPAERGSQAMRAETGRAQLLEGPSHRASGESGRVEEPRRQQGGQDNSGCTCLVTQQGS
jgi:hypothetical protein